MELDTAIAGKVDTVFADMDKPRNPGAALLVVEGGRRIVTRCYGCADLATGRPITADSSFYLASVSKQFTAMAILLLAAQEKLGLDDHLRNYFPQFPAWGDTITLRHLIHQTSGLPDYFGLFLPDKSAPPSVVAGDMVEHMGGLTNAEVLDRTMHVPHPDFPAGSQHAYSNTNYTLLSMIVGLVCGLSFPAFMKAAIFDPLGMANTLVYDASHPSLHNIAHGYVEQAGGFRRWDYPLLTTGDGGMFSTLDDLFLWDQALNNDRLVPHRVLQQFFADGATDDGRSTGYGFGWMTNIFGTARHVAHGGSLGPYNTCMVRYLDMQRTIVLLTNRIGVPGPRVRVQQVADILFGG